MSNDESQTVQKIAKSRMLRLHRASKNRPR
jgi:hypothetical protein